MNDHYSGVASVDVDKRRWYSVVTLFDSDDNVIETLYFSADAGLTYGDGIWAGNEEEYREALDSI